MRIVATIPVISTMMVSHTSGGGFQINEQNARAMGFAGAFVTRHPMPLPLTLIRPAPLFKKDGRYWEEPPSLFPRQHLPDPPPFHDQNLDGITGLLPLQFLPFLRKHDGLTFGLGIFIPYGLGSEWPADRTGRRLSVKTDFKSFYINPSVSYKLAENFSIGAGISYIMGMCL